MIICSCNVLTDSQVRAVADQYGSLPTTQVHCSLGCRPRCWWCFSTIRAILEIKAVYRATKCDGETNESEQGTLGEGRLHPHRRNHARQWRGVRCHAWDQDRARGSGSAVAGDDATALLVASAQTFWVWISRATLSRRGIAQEQGLTNLKFQEGDATDLAGLPNKTFDLVVSVFGAMFAPNPFDVAKEMVRVTRPGGRIVMGNWIPNDPTLVAQILKISAAYTPPPPEGFVSPMTWGIEGNVIERFASAGVPADNVSFTRDTYRFNFPGHAIRVRGCIPTLLRPHHERVRGGGERRPCRRSEEGTGRTVRGPEHQPAQGRHFNPGDLPTRDGCGRLAG